MSIGALLTNQWSGTAYDGYAKLSSKGKQSGAKWIAEVAPELMKVEADKRNAGDGSVTEPAAPLNYSRRISAKFKTEELIANSTENGETIYSYQASEQQFEIVININGDERNYFIKGIDGDGKAFEKEFNPYEVDPENADYTEFTALCLYIQRTDGYADSLMRDFVQPENILEKHNYFSILEKWGNGQAESGDPELYDSAMKMLVAIRAFMEKSLLISGNGGSHVNIAFSDKGIPVSEEAIARLFENQDTEHVKKVECTKGTYAGGDPQKLPKVFYTYYSPEGIKCIREGERNPINPSEKISEDKLQWEINFTGREQYNKVMEFLAEFPEEDNFRFTSNEKFWNDFLSGRIDMEDFREFYAWTDHGEPHMDQTESGVRAGINRERILNHNAEYFNDWTWIRNVWTEEEMWGNWYARIGAAGVAHKVSGNHQMPSGGVETTVPDGMKKTAREYRELAFGQIGINAPDSVKQAWLDAADAAGMDGMGISDLGRLDHIPQFLIQRWIRGMRGENIYDMLGNSVSSAIHVAREALYELEHALEPNRVRTKKEVMNIEKERKFYQEFISRLQKGDTSHAHTKA